MFKIGETMPTGSVPRWYAIHTRSRHEKQVTRYLSDKQIEVFLPLRQEMHRWRDRWKKVELPLFSGYVFAQYDTEQRRLAVLRTPGVVRVVGFGQKDAAVPDEQIEALKKILATDQPLERHRYLRAGQRVRIISGALAGVEGILARVKQGNRLVINIAPIRQAVAVEISGYDVIPLGEKKAGRRQEVTSPAVGAWTEAKQAETPAHA